MAQAAAVDDRPPWARAAHAAAMLELVVLGALWVKLCLDNDAGAAWFGPILCLAAFAGMWRRVAWGRFLFSAISVLMALGLAARMFLTFDRLFAGPAPLLPSWLIVVVTATLVLLLPLLAGWRRHWFRSAGW